MPDGGMGKSGPPDGWAGQIHRSFESRRVDFGIICLGGDGCCERWNPQQQFAAPRTAPETFAALPTRLGISETLDYYAKAHWNDSFRWHPLKGHSSL